MTSSGREYYKEDLSPLAAQIDALGEKARLTIFTRIAERCRPLWIPQPPDDRSSDNLDTSTLLDEYVAGAVEYTTAPIALIAGSKFRNTVDRLDGLLAEHTNETYGSRQLLRYLCDIVISPSSVDTLEFLKCGVEDLQQAVFWNGAIFPWATHRRTHEDMLNGAECATTVVGAIRDDLKTIHDVSTSHLLGKIDLAGVKRLWMSPIWPSGVPNLWNFVVPSNVSNELGPSRRGIYSAAEPIFGESSARLGSMNSRTRWMRIKQGIPRAYGALNDSYRKHSFVYWLVAVVIGLAAAIGGLVLTP